MAGRTFYKAADGSLTPAGKARAYNAELRRQGKAGMLYTGESNFGTAGKETGEIGFGEAEEYVKNGDIIAVQNEDGTITRTKVTEDNRDELLGTRRGTMKPGVEQFSDYGPYQEGQKLKGGTVRRYNDDEVSTGGARSGGRRIVIPASFNEPSDGTARGARVANRNKQKVLQGKPLVSKKQAAYAKRRAESKKKTAALNKKLKRDRKKARDAASKLRAKNARKPKARRKAPVAKKKKKATPKKTTPKVRRSTNDSTAQRTKKRVEKREKAPKIPRVSKKDYDDAAKRTRDFEEKNRRDQERIDREIANERQQRQEAEEKNQANLAAIRAIRERRRKNNS
jgi:hypothetical protein